MHVVACGTLNPSCAVLNFLQVGLFWWNEIQVEIFGDCVRSFAQYMISSLYGTADLIVTMRSVNVLAGWFLLFMYGQLASHVGWSARRMKSSAARWWRDGILTYVMLGNLLPLLVSFFICIYQIVTVRLAIQDAWADILGTVCEQILGGASVCRAYTNSWCISALTSRARVPLSDCIWNTQSYLFPIDLHRSADCSNGHAEMRWFWGFPCALMECSGRLGWHGFLPIEQRSCVSISI